MLEVQRFGDNSTISAVSYTTVDQSAKRGRDYVPTSGVIVFAEGHTSAKILITVLANHDRDEDAMFTVQLSLATTLTYDPVIIGGNSTVTVLIRNLWLLGAYFSTLPQLDNVEEDGERANTAGLYYDLPLTCITVCAEYRNPRAVLILHPCRLVTWPLTPVKTHSVIVRGKGLTTTSLSIAGRYPQMERWSSTL